MGRRGRPRKNRSRHNHNGQQKPPAIPSPRQIAAQMPHRAGLGDNAIDPHAESELGRMLLRGDLGDDGVVFELAGSTYARLWRNYLITLAGPAAILNGGGHGLTCGGCQSEEERRYCRCSMRKNIFLEAQNALFANGPLVGSMVRDTVCNDRRCDRIDLLRHGLAALAYHFGLTKRPIRHQNSHSHETAAPNGAVCVSISGR